MNQKTTKYPTLLNKSREPKEPMDIINVQDLLPLKKGSIYSTVYSSPSCDEDLMSISLCQQTMQKPITIEAPKLNITWNLCFC